MIWHLYPHFGEGGSFNSTTRYFSFDYNMYRWNLFWRKMVFFFLSWTFSAKEVPKPIPLSVAIFTLSFLMIRRDLKNHHVANYGGGKTSLSRYAGLLASILSRAENLSHRCKSVPTGILSAKILTAWKQGIHAAYKIEGKKSKLMVWQLGWK